MNNNQEKITVISSQKPLLPKPVIILLLLAGLIIILLAVFYLQKSFFKQNEPSPATTPETNQNPSKSIPAPKADNIPNPSPPQVQPIPVKGVQK